MPAHIFILHRFSYTELMKVWIDLLRAQMCAAWSGALREQKKGGKVKREKEYHSTLAFHA